MDSDSFALYRLPQHDDCTLVYGKAQSLLSIGDLEGLSGFVVAPFAIDASTPVVLIMPTREACHDMPFHYRDIQAELPDSRDIYSRDFARFHTQLAQDVFGKIVLARRASVECSCRAIDMFHKACALYPHAFVALFSTPFSGTWLVASPEVLLEGHNGCWHTMALAGTMHLDHDLEQLRWSEKNIREQRYVATYISDCLRPFAHDLKELGPRTVKAGNVVHLSSDFTFGMNDDNACHVIEALHPTPAVCGVPKDDALHFILDNEHCDRRYYSGFSGPMATDGETHLYVTLRCMEIGKTSCMLYAGGGLLNDSLEHAEWDETEAKMHAMKNVINRCSATKQI